MKFSRLFLSLGGLALLGTGLGGCLQAPDYSTTPSISNNNVRVSSFKSTIPGGQSIDSVYITINYQDGDGDLGLSGDESKVAPYAYPSLFNNNYFIEPTVKYVGTTTYVAPILQYTITPTTPGTPAAPGTFNARFDHITGLTDSKTAPIKGTLTRTFAFGRGDYFNAGDVVRFDVSIADRALHVSNVIRTDSIVIPKL